MASQTGLGTFLIERDLIDVNDWMETVRTQIKE